ncbi:haloacid dehalogenase type II [Nocardia pseudobrasiliensis]|uniref:2-haloacid dehalogenase n=1 Tax=Nocardia pseudobrasiliensis TaxID=45979 RepID=A0A370IB33_9NOCA|nr:haloacid dehalogenase type II [Nocardia pseudobrasiliensis]RDI67932.1 2-haloacid dehalogenase [Nocardia pseudobrasiliensis]
MTEFDRDRIQVIACDIFGTTVDWYSGVAAQAAEIFDAAGVDLDAGEFADDWREMYAPSMQRVRDGERAWAYLDTLHRESLDTLLDGHGVAGAFDEAARRRLVRAWHVLPAWPDSVAGLERLRRRYTVAALSNGGFALLTRLIKAAALPMDCVVSAELAHSYKPAPEVYRTAAGLLDVEPDRVLMVACHTWDLDGARAAGLRTAFVERPLEKGPHRGADRAADTVSDLVAADFGALADLLGC